MKTTLLLTALFLSLLFVGCSDEAEEEACDEAYAALYSETFRGLIYVCNAEPPYDTTVHGTATVAAVTSDEVSIHLVGDSGYLDTTFYRETSCRLAETKGLIFIQRPIPSHDDGQYNTDPGHISFSWDNPICSRDCFFAGNAQ